jgi:cyclic pyranopterin phosphate synthase
VLTETMSSPIPSPPADAGLRDRLERPVRDLRVSVTDRCNFRCRYCMPREAFGEGFEFLPRSEILHFGEIRQIAGVFRRFGLKKLRLTGGEPLLRKELPRLVGMLAGLGGLEIALTTNGSLLAEQAPALAAAGLDRVTVSLDSLDPEVFARMNDTRVPVERVLEGIEAAAAAGLAPVKVNAVVRRGVNDHTVLDLARRFRGTGHTVLDLARRFRGTGHTVRFIEFMDVGTRNGWRMEEVVPGAEIVERIGAEWPLEPVAPRYPGEVARRWRYEDGAGEIGVITSVTRPFCGGCTRARLSAEGKLYTCLFATQGTDLKTPLREGATDDELADLIANVWRARDDRYSDLRTRATGTEADPPKVEMSYIGG